MRISSRVQINGPLAAFADGFAARLIKEGYTDLSLANQLRLVAHVSRWLQETRTPVTALSARRVRRFVRRRRRTHTALVSESALRPLLGHLREVGVLATETNVDSPRTGVLGRYEKYLTEERAVLPDRRARYLAIADDFVLRRVPARLSAADVTAFIDAQSRQPCLGERLTALRSLLRFLFLDGASAANLVYAVPSSPRWQQTRLPKALEAAQFQAVLATCDRRTAVGCRDYAALLLMGRLGLRAGEVAALSLDDFDWTRGVVFVHGKGGTAAR